MRQELLSTERQRDATQIPHRIAISPLRDWAARQRARAALLTRALAPGGTVERQALIAALSRRLRRESCATDAIPRSLYRLGSVRSLALPTFDLMGDNGATAAALLSDMQGAAAVIFRDMAAADLDRFFWLRICQMDRGQPPAAPLAVILLSPRDGTPPLPPGFAARAASGWPFRRTIFAAANEAERASFAAQLGVPVHRLDSRRRGRLPQPWEPLTLGDVVPPIAVQLQPQWGRCGSSTAFENQVEDLVGQGRFVIRVFIDEAARPGATLARAATRLLAENAVNAGAHINVMALRHDLGHIHAAPEREIDRFIRAIHGRNHCTIADHAVGRAMRRAEAIIVNHVLSIGFALHHCPSARMLLDVHDEFASAAAQSMRAASPSLTASQRAELDEIGQLEGLLWRIPDVCTNVNAQECARVARQNATAVIVLPRPAVRIAADPTVNVVWDAMIVADQHAFNIQSVRWFIDHIWARHLPVRQLRIAVAGRVDRHIRTEDFAGSRLAFLGFVEDLDLLRSQSILTLVPDRAGTGIAVKTLTAMAAGHPLVSTDIGLRGLGDAVTAAIPGHVEAGSFVVDLLALLSDDAKLDTRRAAVRQAYAAIGRGPSFAQCLADLPPASQAVRQKREQAWLLASRFLTEARPLALELPPPLALSDASVLLTPARLAPYLGQGWHRSEGWGQWMDGLRASIRIPLADINTEALDLSLDLAAACGGTVLCLTINGRALPPLPVTNGLHHLSLPEAATWCAWRLDITLAANRTHTPADHGRPEDERVLSVVLRSLCLARRRGQ
jgi:hypothetical protein